MEGRWQFPLVEVVCSRQRVPPQTLSLLDHFSWLSSKVPTLELWQQRDTQERGERNWKETQHPGLILMSAASTKSLEFKEDLATSLGYPHMSCLEPRDHIRKSTRILEGKKNGLCSLSLALFHLYYTVKVLVKTSATPCLKTNEYSQFRREIERTENYYLQRTLLLVLLTPHITKSITVLMFFHRGSLHNLFSDSSYQPSPWSSLSASWHTQVLLSLLPAQLHHETNSYRTFLSPVLCREATPQTYTKVFWDM